MAVLVVRSLSIMPMKTPYPICHILKNMDFGNASKNIKINQ
jgi:hypothetical protein